MRYTTSFALAATLALTPLVGVAASTPKACLQSLPRFPGTLVNARYVYVTSYDGDQFDPTLLPEDRKAIAAVQEAIQKWGKFVLVYASQEADIVMVVTSRPSEDILALYDAQGWQENGQYLWRMTGPNGLQQGETPLVTNLEKAFEHATKR